MNHEVNNLNRFSSTRTVSTRPVYLEELIEKKRAYDSAFKKFFRRRNVLAILLKEVVDEFRYTPLTLIEKAIISNDVYIKDDGTLYGDERDFNTETLYDVVVHCNAGDTEIEVNLIFDLGMQRDDRRPYEVLNRAVYYASSFVSRQSVEHFSYDKVIPVYTAWICFNTTPKDSHNSIHAFRLRDSNCENPIKSNPLINVTLLLLSEQYDWNVEDAYLIKFLQSIFKNRLYDKDFNPDLKLTDEIEKEVLAIKLEPEQYGTEIVYNRAEGGEEGIAIGLVEGTVQTLLNLNYTDEQILNYLIKNNGLTEVDAAYYLDLVKNKYK